MKEEWLFRGALVPIDAETTAALVAEIKRLEISDVVSAVSMPIEKAFPPPSENNADADIGVKP